MKTLLALCLLLFIATPATAADAWIVTWDVTTHFLVSCPSEPQEDEFGRIQQSNSLAFHACFKSDTTSKSRAFANKQDAIEFCLRGQKEESNILDDAVLPTYLSNFKIIEQKEIQ